MTMNVNVENLRKFAIPCIKRKIFLNELKFFQCRLVGLRGHSLVKSLKHFVLNQERNHKKSQEFASNRLHSSISNRFKGGLKSH